MIRTFQGFTTEDKEFAVLLVLINLHILPESYVNNIQIIFEVLKYNYTKCILSWNVYIFKEVANSTSSLLILATKPTTTDDHHL